MVIERSTMRVDTNDPRLGSAGRGLGTIRHKAGATPIYSPYDLEESRERSVEEEVRLAHEAMPPNMAGNPSVAKRARAVIHEHLEGLLGNSEYMKNKWLTLYRCYRFESLLRQQYWRELVSSPEPYKAVENVVPRQHNALFGIDPWYRLEGLLEEDTDAARHQQALCQSQHTDMGYTALAMRLLRSRAIYGTCVQKLYWKQGSRRVTYRVARSIPGKVDGTTEKELATVSREELYYDGNFVRQISLFDFWAPPMSDGAEDAEWAADRSMLSAPKIRWLGEYGDWKNLDELARDPGDQDETQSDYFKLRRFFSLGIFDSSEAQQARHIAHWPCIDWWGPFDLEDGEGEQLANLTMLAPFGPAVIVVARRNPFWHGQKPYQISRYTPLEEELYGVGVVEPIVRLNLGNDTMFNRMLATMELEGNPMYVAEDRANIPDGQLRAIPGLVLRASTSDGIKPLVTPKASDVYLAGRRDIKEEIRETTGITSPIMGESTAETATAHTSEINESNLRMLGGILTFEMEIIKPMLEQMTWNNQQFIDKKKAIKLIGPQGIRFEDRYEVEPSNLVGRFRFVPLAGHRLSMQRVMTQQLINLLDRGPVINQFYGREVVKIPAVLAKVLREGFGFRDIGEMLAVSPEDKTLISAMEEHEIWMHLTIPAVHDEDNHLRHWQMHNEFFGTEKFQWLQAKHPAVATKARAHAAEHAVRLARSIEQMEMAITMSEQQRAVRGESAEAGGRGPATPGQEPGSPKVRRESGMPEDEGAAVKSESGLGAPNQGAQ